MSRRAVPRAQRAPAAWLAFLAARSMHGGGAWMSVLSARFERR